MLKMKKILKIKIYSLKYKKNNCNRSKKNLKNKNRNKFNQKVREYLEILLTLVDLLFQVEKNYKLSFFNTYLGETYFLHQNKKKNRIKKNNKMDKINRMIENS